MTQIGTFLALAVSVSRQVAAKSGIPDMITVSVFTGGYRYLRIRIPFTREHGTSHDHVVYISIANHTTDRTIVRVHDANGEHKYNTRSARDVIERYTRHLLTIYKGDPDEVDQ